MPDPSINRNDATKTSVAFLGSKHAAPAFRSVGFDAFGVSDAREAIDLWDEIVGKGYSVIFVSESLAPDMKSLLEPYYLKTLPAVVLLPEKQPGTGLAAQTIRKAVLKAVGAEI
jgi:vacuolar-type H+-ATPase subunit F/Vma7